MKIKWLTYQDVQYLTGEWDGPVGAAFNCIAEDCKEAGLGTYNNPTEKGKRLIAEFKGEQP